jgi:hypothetical protein
MTIGNVGTDQPGDGPQRCVQCGSTFFEEGFVEDTGSNSQGAVRWIPGLREFGKLGGLKLSGRRRHPVIAYRCTSCHHLALYVGPG